MVVGSGEQDNYGTKLMKKIPNLTNNRQARAQKKYGPDGD